MLKLNIPPVEKVTLDYGIPKKFPPKSDEYKRLAGKGEIELLYRYSKNILLSLVFNKIFSKSENLKYKVDSKAPFTLQDSEFADELRRKTNEKFKGTNAEIKKEKLIYHKEAVNFKKKVLLQKLVSLANVINKLYENNILEKTSFEKIADFTKNSLPPFESPILYGFTMP